MKLRKGDTVIVISGKDKGKEGAIERIYKKQEKVVIAQINMHKKHMKKSQDLPQGGVIEVPRPIHISNVMLKCPKSKKPTRVGYSINDGVKKRVSRKAKNAIIS